MDGRSSRSIGATGRTFLTVLVVVLIIAWLGIASRMQDVLASFWPANAVLAGMMIRSPRYRSVVGAAGAFAGYLLADLSTGNELVITVVLTTANMLSVGTVVMLLAPRSEAVRQLVAPVGILAVLGASACGGLAALVAGIPAGVQEFGMSVEDAAQAWWSGEFSGYASVLIAVLAAPRLDSLGWASLRARMQAVPLAHLQARAARLLALAASLGVGLFLHGPLVLMLAIPVLAWIALRATVFETALVALCVQAVLEFGLRSGLYDLGFDYGALGSTSQSSIRVALGLIAVGPLMVAADTTRRTARMRTLESDIGHDALTCVLSRRALFDQGGRVLTEAASRGQGAAVLLIDVDDFKRVNDTYGHATGDQVLIDVAGCCRGVLSEGDLVGRLGGDELAVVVLGVDRDAARDRGEAILAAVAASALLHDLGVTVSVGVAVRLGWPAQDGVGDASAPTPAPSMVEMLARADQVLLVAKRAGRNRVVLAA